MDALRAAIVTLLVLAASLAGCIGGDGDEVDPTQPGPGDGPAQPRDDPSNALPFKFAKTTNIEQALQAVEFVPRGDEEFSRPNMTKKDWLLFSVPVTAAGVVHGFAYEVPEGVLVRPDDATNYLLLLDFAVALQPMGHPETLPEDLDWAIAVFHEHIDESGTVTARLGDYQYGVTKSLLAPDGSEQSVPAVSDPFTLRVEYGELRPGHTIWFLLAARGQEGDEFAVGARILGQEYFEFTNNDSPTLDWEDFYAIVGQRAPLVPERKATGEGLYIALHAEDHQTTEGVSTMETTADVEVSDALPKELYPTLTARDFSIASQSGGGWSVGYGEYESGGELGNWEIRGDLHGASFDRAGQFFNNQGLPGELGGRDSGIGFSGSGSGTNEASIDWAIQKPGTLEFESFQFLHLNMGIPVATLTGLDYTNQAEAIGGL